MTTTVQSMTLDIYKAFKERDIRALRKLNDRCIEAISLSYNKEIYDLAIISYVLSKVLSKPRYWNKPNISGFFVITQSNLKAASDFAKSGELSELSDALANVTEGITKLEASDRRFITDMLSKAKLKVASTLYAQGFSLGNASEITGVEKREIQSYAGGTMMFDRVKPEKTMVQRLKILMKIFR